MDVQIDWLTNTIVNYGTLQGLNVFHGAPDDYDPAYYSWTPSVANTFNPNDFKLKAGVIITPIKLAGRPAQLQAADLYLSNLLTKTQYRTVLADSTTLMSNYLYGHSDLLDWISGTGIYTITGFPGKLYFNAAVQTKLLSLLS